MIKERVKEKALPWRGRGRGGAITKTPSYVHRSRGMVTVKAAQPGEIVSPYPAGGGFTRTGIGTMVDMASLEVEVDVSENFIAACVAGQMPRSYGSTLTGLGNSRRNHRRDPAADRSKATVRVRVGFHQKVAPRDPPRHGRGSGIFGNG